MNKRLASPQLMRAAMALIGFVCTLATFAQKPPELDYTITFTTVISLTQSKFIHEALRSQDPDAVAWVEQASHIALARTHVHLDPAEFQVAIAPSGLVVQQLSAISGGDPVIRNGLPPASSERMPEYQNTGDATRDNIRYEVAKRAWIDAHPDGYEQLKAPVPE